MMLSLGLGFLPHLDPHLKIGPVIEAGIKTSDRMSQIGDTSSAGTGIRNRIN